VRGGGVPGGASSAGAASPSPSPGPGQRGASQPAFDPTKGGHVGANGVVEKLLTGTTADKARAAALAAVPGATIERVETDAEGAVYEAHMVKSDGTPVTVKMDANFKVTGIETGPNPPARCPPPSRARPDGRVLAFINPPGRGGVPRRWRGPSVRRSLARPGARCASGRRWRRAAVGARCARSGWPPIPANSAAQAPVCGRRRIRVRPRRTDRRRT